MSKKIEFFAVCAFCVCVSGCTPSQIREVEVFERGLIEIEEDVARLEEGVQILEAKPKSAIIVEKEESKAAKAGDVCLKCWNDK